MEKHFCLKKVRIKKHLLNNNNNNDDYFMLYLFNGYVWTHLKTFVVSRN